MWTYLFQSVVSNDLKAILFNDALMFVEPLQCLFEKQWQFLFLKWFQNPWRMWQMTNGKCLSFAKWESSQQCADFVQSLFHPLPHTLSQDGLHAAIRTYKSINKQSKLDNGKTVSMTCWHFPGIDTPPLTHEQMAGWSIHFSVLLCTYCHNSAWKPCK